jgi:uroporphyrinogen decarboxylase
MNKRTVMLNLLDATAQPAYTPAGFFIHFPEEYRHGQAAVDKHLEFFHYTEMDLVKIQYESEYPLQPHIQKPADWATLQPPDAAYFQDAWDIARGLVQAAGKEALVIQTLYSPFMLAAHAVGAGLLEKHLREDPHQTRKGIEIVTESLLTFVRGCIAAGVDGFYHSTQGGETFRFEDSPIFETCIKPFDLAVMHEVNNATPFNILHICDYAGGYTSLQPFVDYPGDVVNCSLQLASQKLTGQQVSDLFDRPFMGGIERLGTIASGSPDQVKTLAGDVLADSSERFILAADCTLPPGVNWDNIKTAIAAAHAR